MDGLLVWLVVGLVAGVLASFIMGGIGFGIVRRIPVLTVLALLLVVPGCDAVENVRSRFGTTDTLTVDMAGTGLMLGLQSSGMLRAGQEGVLRVSVTNRSDTIARDIRLELVVPEWIEPMTPRPGEREVTMAALDDGRTRFAYSMADTPIEPGLTEHVDQRFRVAGAGMDSVPAYRSRIVQARLLDVHGEPLAEVESEIVIDRVVSAGVTGSGAAGRDEIGSARIGMSASALSRIQPPARDTTWTEAGVRQEGAWVAVPGGGRVLAVLSGDSVTRLEVHDTTVRTPERLGVGSRLEQLKSAYGDACADLAGGAVVVSFAAAPGARFALDAPASSDAAQLRDDPGQLPEDARVTRWWLQGGAERCPP